MLMIYENKFDGPDWREKEKKFLEQKMKESFNL